MNYAEDRLDRRAAAKEDTTTHDQLDCDLKRAHSIFHDHGYRPGNGCETPPPPSQVSPLTLSFLDNIRAAHALAGRTLRDSGRNRQAVFHFGMAWKICHWCKNLRHRNSGASSCDNIKVLDDYDSHENDEWKSVGDYAQMCEFSGFPEIGVFALLFYRVGGHIEFDSITPVCLPVVDDSSHEPVFIRHHGCGCKMVDCGRSPCFVAFPYKSSVMDNILSSLDSLAINDKSFPCALDVLAHLASMSRKADIVYDPTGAMNDFLCTQQSVQNMPSILRYWDNCTRDQSDHRRVLPPVILLLLLKLLYSSPMSGSFLQLACISVPYLAGRFPFDSPEGKMLAQQFKSHWAYFVFIRALVLGQRLKKHRQAQTPVWDVVFCAGSDTLNATLIEKDKRVDKLDYYRRILLVCSIESSRFSTDQVSSIPCSLEQGVSPNSIHRPIFVLGDSHVLSLAWQTMHIVTSKNEFESRERQNGQQITRTAIPFPATGLKAWHVRPSTRFFTHYNLHACLKRLPLSGTSRTLILSAGEIDCREGIGGSLLQGYYRNCSDAVTRTVIEYLTSLSDLALKFLVQILVMPVSPHAYRSEKNGKSTGRARRRETTHLWNESLRQELKSRSMSTPQSINSTRRMYEGVFLLDYEKQLRHPDCNSPVGYVLHQRFNADFTHLNSAIVPLIEDAISSCGCDLALL